MVMTEEERCKWLSDAFKSVGEKSNLAHFMGSSRKKINLGCGAAPEPVWNNWVNVDINKRSAAGIVFDMREPWPIKPETFDTAFACMLFQCFWAGEEIVHVFSEIWEILKPGGWLVGVVPEMTAGNPLQKSLWSVATPSMMCKSSYFQSELSTTAWDQGLPFRDWKCLSVQQQDSHIWFVLQKSIMV